MFDNRLTRFLIGISIELFGRSNNLKDVTSDRWFNFLRASWTRRLKRHDCKRLLIFSWEKCNITYVQEVNRFKRRLPLWDRSFRSRTLSPILQTSRQKKKKKNHGIRLVQRRWVFESTIGRTCGRSDVLYLWVGIGNGREPMNNTRVSFPDYRLLCNNDNNNNSRNADGLYDIMSVVIIVVARKIAREKYS